jgi:multisubunit Na+/H+ antiporter MnhB subunit
MHPPKKREEKEYQTSLVVRLVSRMMCPFIAMFGASLIVHGHLTPGGGFQGGVAIGASFILYALAFDRHDGRKIVPSFSLKCMACLGIYLYIGVGLLGIFLGYHFLSNKIAGIMPTGMFGELFSGGSLFWINCGVGLAVASISTELFYAFLEEQRSEGYEKDRVRLPEKRRWSDVDHHDSVQN